MTPGKTFCYEQRIIVFKGHNIIKIVPLKFFIPSYHIMKLMLQNTLFLTFFMCAFKIHINCIL